MSRMMVKRRLSFPAGGLKKDPDGTRMMVRIHGIQVYGMPMMNKRERIDFRSERGGEIYSSVHPFPNPSAGNIMHMKLDHPAKGQECSYTSILVIHPGAR